MLCDFINEGHFGRHLRRMREVYAERLSILMESARKKLAGLLQLSSVEQVCRPWARCARGSIVLRQRGLRKLARWK